MANNYILLPNGSAIPEDELYHWKYIKREKQPNGKYKYYYDTAQLKNDVKKIVSDPLGTKAKKEYQQAQQNRINAQNAVSGRTMSDLNYREASKGNGPNTTSANNRADREKAVSQYRSDSTKLAVAKGNEKKAKEAYDKTLLGKAEKIPDNVRNTAEAIKQKIQDVAGVDEKKYRDYAKNMSEKADEEYRKTREDKSKQDFNLGLDATDEDWNKVLEWNDKVDKARNKKFEWGQEYVKADKAFMKTPLGMYEKAAELLDDAAFEISYATEKASDKIKDAAYSARIDTEVAIERGLGISQRREYESSKKTLAYYTEQVDKLTKLKKDAPYSFNNKHESDLWMAEIKVKEYERKVKQDRSGYYYTPMGRIESGMEYVSNLFKKKTK